MKENEGENNVVRITGTICKPVEFSHSAGGQKFFRTVLAVRRLSGTVDFLPLILPESRTAVRQLNAGERVRIRGQMRSYNRRTDEKNHLILLVYVAELEAAGDSEPDSNELKIRGVICRQPVLRTTPLGRRACDLLLAVRRSYGRADYLPAIAWGKTAQKASMFTVGEQIVCNGRVQSRAYTKRYPDGRSEERTAYEVSLVCADAVDTTEQEE